MNRRGIAVVAIGFVAFLASSPGQSFFVAAFLDDILADTGLSRTGFSVVYAVATVFSAVMVLGVGRAIDRLGDGPVWAIVTLGLAAALGLLSVASAVWVVLIALCGMRAFGQGALPLVGTVLIASSFDRTRGRAFSISAQGFLVGGTVLPGVSVALISLFGWRVTLQLVAAALLIAVLPLALAVGRLTRDAPVRPEGARQGPGAAMRASLRRPGVVTLLAISTVGPLIITGVVVHAISLLRSVGVSTGAAAGALGALALAGTVGALTAGVLVDRFAPRVVLALSGALLATGAATLAVDDGRVATAGFVVLGVAGGVFHTANGSLWAHVYGTEGLGGLQGLASSAQIAGAAVGPLPPAVSLGATGSYVPGLIALAGLGLVALVAGARWSPPSFTSLSPHHPQEVA